MWSQWPPGMGMAMPPMPAMAAPTQPPLPDAPPPPATAAPTSAPLIGPIMPGVPATTIAPSVAAPAAMDPSNPYSQYTAAQYAAMTPEQQFALQQHSAQWQVQWQAYQAEYAKWHAQYGEQYKREMAAATTTTTAAPTNVDPAAASQNYQSYYQQPQPQPQPQLQQQQQPPPPPPDVNQQQQLQQQLPGKISGQPQMYSQLPPTHPQQPPQMFNNPQQQQWPQQSFNFNQPPPNFNQLPPLSAPNFNTQPPNYQPPQSGSGQQPNNTFGYNANKQQDQKISSADNNERGRDRNRNQNTSRNSNSSNRSNDRNDRSNSGSGSNFGLNSGSGSNQWGPQRQGGQQSGGGSSTPNQWGGGGHSSPNDGDNKFGGPPPNQWGPIRGNASGPNQWGGPNPTGNTNARGSDLGKFEENDPDDEDSGNQWNQNSRNNYDDENDNSGGNRWGPNQGDNDRQRNQWGNQNNENNFRGGNTNQRGGNNRNSFGMNQGGGPGGPGNNQNNRNQGGNMPITGPGNWDGNRPNNSGNFGPNNFGGGPNNFGNDPNRGPNTNFGNNNSGHNNFGPNQRNSGPNRGPNNFNDNDANQGGRWGNNNRGGPNDQGGNGRWGNNNQQNDNNFNANRFNRNDGNFGPNNRSFGPNDDGPTNHRGNRSNSFDRNQGPDNFGSNRSNQGNNFDRNQGPDNFGGPNQNRQFQQGDNCGPNNNQRNFRAGPTDGQGPNSRQQPQQRGPDLDEEGFDRQFKQWEQQFEDWKRANADHPDRDMYKRYEQEFTNQRMRIMERREQMRKRKMEQMGIQSGQDQNALNDPVDTMSDEKDNDVQDITNDNEIDNSNKVIEQNSDVECIDKITEQPIQQKPGTNQPSKSNSQKEISNQPQSLAKQGATSSTVGQNKNQNQKNTNQSSVQIPIQNVKVNPFESKSKATDPSNNDLKKTTLGKRKSRFDAAPPAKVMPEVITEIISLDDDDDDDVDNVIVKPTTQTIAQTPAKPTVKPMSEIFKKSEGIPGLDLVEDGVGSGAEKTANKDEKPLEFLKHGTITDGPTCPPVQVPATTLSPAKKIPSLFDIVIKPPMEESMPQMSNEESSLAARLEAATAAEGLPDIGDALKDPDFMQKISAALAKAQGRDKPDHDSAPPQQFIQQLPLLLQQLQQQRNSMDDERHHDGRPMSFAEWQRRKQQPGFDPSRDIGSDFGDDGPNSDFGCGPNFRGGNGPNFGGNGPNFGGNGPNFGPNFGGNGPNFRGNGPNFGGPGPNFGGFGPNNRGNGPNFGGNGPNNRGNGPNFGGNGPNFGGFGPNNRGNGPNYGGNGPNFGGNGPNNRGNGPNFGGPNFDGPNNRGNGPNFGGNFGGPNFDGPNNRGNGPNFGGGGPNNRGNGPNIGEPNFDGNAPNNRGNGPNFGGGNGPNNRGFGPNNRESGPNIGGGNGPNKTEAVESTATANVNNPFRRSGGPNAPVFEDDKPTSNRNFGQKRGGSDSGVRGDSGNDSNTSWIHGTAVNKDYDEFFQPMQIIDYQNGSPMAPAPTVIDYGHKTTAAVGVGMINSNEFKPVKTFDYGHASNTVNTNNRFGMGAPNMSINPNAKKRNRNKKKNQNPQGHQQGSQQTPQQPQLNPNTIPIEVSNVTDTTSVQNNNAEREGLEEISDGEESLRAESNDSPPPPPPPMFSSNSTFMPVQSDISAVPMSIFPSTAEANENIQKTSAGHVQMSFPTVENQNTITIDEILLHPGRLSRPKKICIILRGPPGSGKSHVAKLVKEKEKEMGGGNPRILSIDDYFIIENDYVEKCPKTGKKIPKKELLYEYDKNMEQKYMQYLIKSFKKTINDNLYDFIIVDCNNSSLRTLNEFYCQSKDTGFVPYIVDLFTDVETCLSRNIHSRSEADIRDILKFWNPTPFHYIKLDVSTLLENLVEMEDADDMVMDNDFNSETADSCDINSAITNTAAETAADGENNDEEDSNEAADPTASCGFLKSKWECDTSSENLARLDGTNKRMAKRGATMEDFLQSDEWEPPKTNANGKKRVRWADIEEKHAQDKMRAIGFVVGQTDWKRMMDPNAGNRALNKTKYIERVNKRR